MYCCLYLKLYPLLRAPIYVTFLLISVSFEYFPTRLLLFFFHTEEGIRIQVLGDGKTERPGVPHLTLQHLGNNSLIYSSFQLSCLHFALFSPLLSSSLLFSPILCIFSPLLSSFLLSTLLPQYVKSFWGMNHVTH